MKLGQDLLLSDPIKRKDNSVAPYRYTENAPKKLVGVPQ